MRSRPWWWYLALLVMTVAASLFVERSFGLVVLLAGFVTGAPVYRSARASGRPWLLAPYGLLLALALGALYYAGDLLVFPHSPRAPQRLRDACCLGVFYSLAGFLVEWNRHFKGLPMLSDPPVPSVARRRRP